MYLSSPTMMPTTDERWFAGYVGFDSERRLVHAE